MVCDAHLIFGESYDEFDDVGKRLVLFGIGERVGNSAAGDKSPNDRHASMVDDWTQITIEKTWTAAKKVAMALNDLASAMAEVKFGEKFTEANLAVAQAAVVAAEKTQQKAWSANKRVFGIVKRIEEKRAAEKAKLARAAAKDDEEELKF